MSSTRPPNGRRWPAWPGTKRFDIEPKPGKAARHKCAVSQLGLEEGMFSPNTSLALNHLAITINRLSAGIGSIQPLAGEDKKFDASYVINGVVSIDGLPQGTT